MRRVGLHGLQVLVAAIVLGVALTTNALAAGSGVARVLQANEVSASSPVVTRVATNVIAPFQFGRFYAGCAPGEQVISGGWSSYVSLALGLGSSPGATANFGVENWSVSLVGGSPESRIAVYANCLRATAGVTVTTRISTGVIGPNTQGYFYSGCQPGEQVVGGGSESALQLYGNSPGAKENFGVENWAVSLFNRSGRFEVPVKVYASCLRLAPETGRSVTTRIATAVLNPLAQGTFSSGCAAGEKVIGGGWSSTGRRTVLSISEYPVPSATSTESWNVFLASVTDVETRVKVYAICMS